MTFWEKPGIWLLFISSLLLRIVWSFLVFRVWFWLWFFFFLLIWLNLFALLYIPIVIHWPDELWQVLPLKRVGMKHMLAMWWEWNEGINFLKWGKAILWTSLLCYKTTKIQMFWLTEWKIAILHMSQRSSKVTVWIQGRMVSMLIGKNLCL